MVNVQKHQVTLNVLSRKGRQIRKLLAEMQRTRNRSEGKKPKEHSLDAPVRFTNVQMYELSLDLSDKKHWVPGQSPVVVSADEGIRQPIFLHEGCGSCHVGRFNTERYFRREPCVNVLNNAAGRLCTGQADS